MVHRISRIGSIGLLGGALAVACSAANSGSEVSGSGGSGGGSGGGPSGGSGGGFDTDAGNGGNGGLTEEPPCNPSNLDLDSDGDGFTGNQGDCNDCTAQMNPGAYDYEGNGIDEDCNGTPDDEPSGCDVGLQIGDPDPMNALKAMGLCRVAQGASWGVVSANFVQADGAPGPAPEGHGILPDFGPVMPREGNSIFVISSGTARAPGDPGYQSPEGANMGVNGFAPTGFPIDSPSCAPVQTDTDKRAQDASGLEFVLRTPTNAKQMRFDFNFYTYEFPEFVCTRYNDFFVALVNPPPPNAQNSNISFDAQGNPISVNNSLLEVCSPQTTTGAVPKSFACAQGPGELSGTGFEGAAATGWLSTQAPVEPGSELRVRFAVWDMGVVFGLPDHVLDSTVLLDNWGWEVDPGEEQGPVTKPVPR